jgi:predicted nucleic acid-binding protein
VIVVDTGPLVALVNSSDADHQRCVQWIEAIDETLLVPNTPC